MTYIGIDFSLNAPAVVVQSEIEEHYYVYYNTYKRYTGGKDLTYDDYISKYNELYLLNSLKGMNLRLRRVIPKELKSTDYVKSFRKKFTNYTELVNLILEDVSKYSDVVVGIEGYSFSSSNNNIIDLAECTFHLKHRIITEVLNGDVDKLYVFAPSQIKKFTTGKGNANKIKMFEAILDDKWEGKLCDMVRLHKNTIKNGEKIVSPFDDIIDAFFVKEMLKAVHT